MDKVKGLVISFAIGYPMLCVLLWVVHLPHWWIWAFIISFCFQLLMMIIYPMFIMPLFNKFEPLPEGDLRDRLMTLAECTGFKAKTILVMDGSKRSAHSNAFFTGFGKTKRIALFDTLIEQLSTDEIVSVIAHEVGHNKKRHVVSGMALGVLHTGVLLFLFSLVMENQSLFEAFSMKSTSIYATIVFFSLLFTPIELIISPVMHFISRRNEYQADQWAVETTTSNNNLISGLKKLAAENLANLSPHPLFVVLNYSHPPLFNRVESINSLLSCRKESGA